LDDVGAVVINFNSNKYYFCHDRITFGNPAVISVTSGLNPATFSFLSGSNVKTVPALAGPNSAGRIGGWTSKSTKIQAKLIFVARMF
jgi:hypothetical protein